MNYNFKFARKDFVVALDYSEPPREYNAVVMRRWLEEGIDEHQHCYESQQPNLQEHYEVLIDDNEGKPRVHKFTGSRLRFL